MSGKVFGEQQSSVRQGVWRTDVRLICRSDTCVEN